MCHELLMVFSFPSFSNSCDHDQRHASSGSPPRAEKTKSGSGSSSGQRLQQSPGQPLIPPIALHALLKPSLLATLKHGKLLQLFRKSTATAAALHGIGTRNNYCSSGGPPKNGCISPSVSTTQYECLHYLECSEQLRECTASRTRTSAGNTTGKSPLPCLHRVGTSSEWCRPGSHRPCGSSSHRSDRWSSFSVPGVRLLPRSCLLLGATRRATISEASPDCVRPVHLCAIGAPKRRDYPGNGRFLNYILLLFFSSSAASRSAAAAVAGDAACRRPPAAATTSGGAWGARGGGQPQGKFLQPLDADES